MEQREKSILHLTVSGTKDAVMMVEAGAKEVTEDEMLEAIMLAHAEIKEAGGVPGGNSGRGRQGKGRY